tara:strand:+ start:199 stop:420 length:222 start_codon:yes stop_codon:yes gene_type:complete
MNIKSFEYKKSYSLPTAGITLFYVDDSRSICHLYEPINNSFYIDNDDFKSPYFKTENDAQQFINRIKNNDVTV